MKNVIPFQKELCFDTKVSEIISISLERNFEVDESDIKGNLLISGEYKSHEISANVIPFSFKIPFTIALASNLNKDTISLEINDFSYDMKEDNKIKVSIELELKGDVLEEEKTEVTDGYEEIIPILEKQEDRASKEENVLDDKKIEEENIILQNTVEDNEYVTYHIYIVSESDTVDSICSKYQINEELLKEYNSFTELNVGDKLLIPINYE